MQQQQNNKIIIVSRAQTRKEGIGRSGGVKKKVIETTKRNPAW